MKDTWDKSSVELSVTHNGYQFSTIGALQKPKLRIELVKFCSISGNPGCLGYPEWHDEDCDYVDIECLFCECGGHNVYGEMAHEESCYYFANPDEAQSLLARYGHLKEA